MCWVVHVRRLKGDSVDFGKLLQPDQIMFTARLNWMSKENKIFSVCIRTCNTAVPWVKI